MRFYRFSFLAFAICLAQLLSGASSGWAQNAVAFVDDQAISERDVAERQRYMSLTNNFNERMKAALGSAGQALQKRFQEELVRQQVRSEAKAKEIAENLKKQFLEETKQRVLAQAPGGRKAALDALIEDKIKLLAAKDAKIEVTDKEVDETFGGRAEDAYKQFQSMGISRDTIKTARKAALAWRELIRREYGPQLQSMMAASAASEKKPDDSELVYNLKVLRLTVSDPNDQAALVRRQREAENIRSKFQSCDVLTKQAQLLANSSVKSIEKAKLASFSSDIQQLLSQAQEGQMTPAVVVSGAVESYAICSKGVPVSKDKTANQDKAAEKRQAEIERYSKRLMDRLKLKYTVRIVGNS